MSARFLPDQNQRHLLETIFSADSFPTYTVRLQLAQQLGIEARQVQIWFQNRRQRERLRVGKVSVQPCTPSMTAGAGVLAGGSTTAHCPAPAAPQDALTADRLLASGREGRFGSLVPEVTVTKENELPSAAPAYSCPCAGRGTACVEPIQGLSPALSSRGERAECGATSESGATVAACIAPSSTESAAACGLFSHLPVPTNAPPALYTMLDTPGGPRALAAAARSLLLHNPILQHPGAPCHSLLMRLAAIQPVDAAGSRTVPGLGAVGAATTDAEAHTVPGLGSVGAATTNAEAGGGADSTPMLLAECDAATEITDCFGFVPRSRAQPTKVTVPPRSSRLSCLDDGFADGRCDGSAHAFNCGSSSDRGSKRTRWDQGDVRIRNRSTWDEAAKAEQGDGGGRALLGSALRRDVSSEAVEVLSSQFFTGISPQPPLRPVRRQADG